MRWFAIAGIAIVFGSIYTAAALAWLEKRREARHGR